MAVALVDQVFLGVNALLLIIEPTIDSSELLAKFLNISIALADLFVAGFYFTVAFADVIIFLFEATITDVDLIFTL